MRNLLRKPLTWMVLAEFAVVAALFMVAWHLLATMQVQGFPSPPAVSPLPQAGDPTGPVASAVTTPPEPLPLLPGLNVDAAFWRTRLAELNRGEAEFEVLEWRLVHSAMDAAHRYVQSVVIPSITQAER
jgi:hypothetical protein